MLKTTWICLLWLSLLGGFPSGCSASYAVAREPVRQATEIPFEMYNDNLVVVEGTIGSMEDVKILVDTGTGTTIVAAEIATKLDVRENPEKVRLTSLGDSLDVRSAVVSQIKIGALHLSPARVIVHDLSFLRQRLGVSIGAIAGLDVLTTQSFMIDYRKRKLISSSMEVPKKSLPFETQKPFLTVKVNIAGHELRLLLDSGTPGVLVFRDRLRTSSLKLEELSNRNALMFTGAGTMQARWFRASEVFLGTKPIGPQVVLVAESNSDADVGLDGLLGFTMTGFQRVWLDFENGLFGWS